MDWSVPLSGGTATHGDPSFATAGSRLIGSRTPEGIYEVGDQEDADDDADQEVGDVRRKVARKLGGKVLVGFGLIYQECNPCYP